MRSASTQASDRFALRIPHAVWVVALFTSWLVACSGEPTASRARAGDEVPVRVRLAAGVVAAPGALIDAHVTFTPAGTASAITVAHDSLVVSTGEGPGTLTLLGDAGPCMAAAPAGSSCQLDLHVRLTRDGALLDEQTQRLSVADGTTQLSAAPVQLYEVASIEVSPSSAVGFQTADSLILAATPRDRSGTAVAARTATWSVVSGSVSVGASGVVRALQPGNAVVRATVGGRTQDLALTVLSPMTATASPVNAAGDVLIESSITVTFSENVNPASVSAATVTLTRNGVAVAATRSTNGRVVTLTPTAPLTEFQSTYVVTVTPDLQSTQGTRLASPLTSSFATIFWDPNYTYRITNSSTGGGRSLDLTNEARCTMVNNGSSAGQAWFFLRTIPWPGYYTMHTAIAGTAAALEGAIAPTSCFMTTSSNVFTGMTWRPSAAPPTAPGAYYLQNLNFGVNRSLDIANTIPQMSPTSNTSSQFWTFTRLSRR